MAETLFQAACWAVIGAVVLITLWAMYRVHTGKDGAPQ